MPPRFDPVASDRDSQGMIQGKRTDCGPATGREADKACPLGAPRKVCRPLLLAWMIQGNMLSGFGVETMRVYPLMLIAQLAGEA